MIKINTALRKRFSALDVRLQQVLVRDLGFLSLPDESAQLAFVEGVLALDRYQREVFLSLMISKQESAEYVENVKVFDDDFSASILPKLKRIADEEMKKAEEKERFGLDESLENAINQS